MTEVRKQTIGKQSIQFEHAVHILSGASIVGKKEGDGPLGKCFDVIGGEDGMFGCQSGRRQRVSFKKKPSAWQSEGRAGELADPHHLRGRSSGTDHCLLFWIIGFDTPVYGLYGACATMGEALSLSSMSVAAGYGDYVVAVTSSHFGSAEKEFRFPLGYGNQRPLSATWTVTGSGACVLGTKAVRHGSQGSLQARSLISDLRIL